MEAEPIRPIRFSHAVLKTFDVERLRNWYITTLGARVAFEQLPFASFLAYDGEHHRIGVTKLQGEPVTSAGRAPGLAHLAFTFTDVTTLLLKYEQMRDAGVTPQMCVNHGPTISFYYLDPDGNGVELLMDRFATVAEANAFMASPVFQKNFNGIELDPEQLLARLKGGASEAELAAYDESIEVDVAAMNAKFAETMREA